MEGLGASEYLAEVHGVEDGRPAAPDVAAQRLLCHWLADSVQAGLLRAAHDLSDGGLAVALAEMALAGTTGLTIRCHGNGRTDALLFGEVPGRVIIAYDENYERELRASSATAGLAFESLGYAGAPSDVLSIEPWIELSLQDARDAYEDAIRKLMQ
jgi:phosphoribosylformylglycinamidine synthase